MFQVLLIFALGSLQDDTIRRSDVDKGAYQQAVDTCKEAENLLTSSPEAALEKLARVFDILDKSRLTRVEKLIRIEVNAQDFIPHDFYPYSLRGRARLLAARKQKDEEARRLLIGAATDLQASVARKADRSREPLAEAQKELWENLRAALTYDEGWKRERAGLADQALALLAASDLSKEAADWMAAEVGKVEAHLYGLRKTIPDLEARKAPAGRAFVWCETVMAAVQPLPAFQGAQAAAAKARKLAVAIRDSRGTFRLKIGVSPWAKVERLERPGEEIKLADPHTPLLVPQELEIDTYTVELDHPNGRKKATILANSLEPGRTYVLWGDMSGDKFDVSEVLPK